MKKIDVYAYYFPNWHVDKRNEQWHGKGWTEWEVAKCARPRFEGHEQPRIPIWGYEDEADPKVMAKKIDTAAEYGIDGFIWDTYWYEDGPYRQRALDEGFLCAPNNNKLKFSLMWCNHDAIYAHPAPRTGVPVLKSGNISEEAFVNMTNIFIEKYFSKPNYIKVDGKIFFIIYDAWRFTENMGGMDNAKRVLGDFRQRVRDAGLGEMQLGFVPAIIKQWLFPPKKEEFNSFIKELGLDEAVRYWWEVPNDRLTYDFKDYVNDGINTFRGDAEFFDIPTNITVINGLDQSPRTIQSDTYEITGVYPYYTVIINCNVKDFERALVEAKKFSESKDYKGHFITITSWNEWTEGNYLEPDTKNGYGYLEAVKKVLGK